MIIHNKNELEDEYDLKGVSNFKGRSSVRDHMELFEKLYTEQQDSSERSKKSAKRKSRPTGINFELRSKFFKHLIILM